MRQTHLRKDQTSAFENRFEKGNPNVTMPLALQFLKEKLLLPSPPKIKQGQPKSKTDILDEKKRRCFR